MMNNRRIRWKLLILFAVLIALDLRSGPANLQRAMEQGRGQGSSRVHCPLWQEIINED
jgi:hypothetical protein